MRNTMRWLSVVGGLCVSWALPAMAEGTPVDCGGIDCEGIREMRALHEVELAFMAERDRFIYRVEVTGTGPAMTFTATARGVSGLVEGTTIKVNETGLLTITPRIGGGCD